MSVDLIDIGGAAVGVSAVVPSVVTIGVAAAAATGRCRLRAGQLPVGNHGVGDEFALALAQEVAGAVQSGGVGATGFIQVVRVVGRRVVLQALRVVCVSYEVALLRQHGGGGTLLSARARTASCR